MSFLKNISSALYLGKKNQLPLHSNVNHEKKFIFIHIPKNAGTSLSAGLGIKGGSHFIYLDYKRLLGKDIKSYFSFCFVRNPFDRFISLYNYARMDESFYHSSIDPKRKEFGKHLDYDLLKNKSVEECAIHLINGDLKHDIYYNHWLPQATWLKDDLGNLQVSYIGKVENMELDIYNLNNMIKMGLSNLRLNQSTGQKDYRRLINSETRNILEQYYKSDLEIFGYDF